MTTEQWSLLISVAAFLIAGLALGWNIYRDVILKARVKVRLKIVNLYNAPGALGPPIRIEISATNFGPGRVRIMNVALMEARLPAKILHTKKYAILFHDWENPYNPELPSWIEEGDSKGWLFPFDEECFLSKDFTEVGFYDYYGRSHWAPKEDLVEAKRIWKEKFGKETDK